MAQNKPINLLDVAKTLDPRFVEDMPQEVADAFARGEVQRLIRTSDALPTAENAMGANVSETGDYAGSIYVQLKTGRIARFKNPEIAREGGDMRHSGWKAKTAGVEGRSPFFDQARVIQDAFDKVDSPERITLDKTKKLNPTLSTDEILFGVARQGHPIATPTTAPASDIMGKRIYETMQVGSTDIDAGATHRGHNISDIFESTGERYYFAGDTGRGSLATEPIDSYISRKNVVATAAVPQSAEPTVEKEKPKAVIETTKEGRPVIKVGTPVNTTEEPATKEAKKTPLKAGKKVEKASKKTEEVAQLPSMGGVLDDALSVAVSPKETSEALVEKAQEKMDPTKKVEERIEKEKEKAQEKLLDNFIEVDNARFRSAAGKAPVDTAFKKKLVEGITSVTGKAPGRTTMELLDAGEGLAGSVISAAKNGKNLRLAGTAALLSVAGFAIGKGRDRMGNQPDGPMGPDEASNLRKSLMSDG